MSEPLIHSHITDELPTDHPLAFETVPCRICGAMLHAVNNECMQTWVETGKGNYCLACFGRQAGAVLEDEWSPLIGAVNKVKRPVAPQPHSGGVGDGSRGTEGEATGRS